GRQIHGTREARRMQLRGGDLRHQFQKVWKIAARGPVPRAPEPDGLFGRYAIYIEGERAAQPGHVLEANSRGVEFAQLIGAAPQPRTRAPTPNLCSPDSK